jgi:hypothetical protein
MAQHRNTDFVGVSLTPAARDALKRLALALSARTGRRMSMSDAVIYLEQQQSRPAAKPAGPR